MKIPNENELASAQSVDSDGGTDSPPSGGPSDFSEYMWMENQDEFDRQVIQELELVAPREPGDFSEFMWMENEEEFDKEVLRQLEEEALMKQCIESMLDDGDNGGARRSTPDIARGLAGLRLQDRSEVAQKSNLNPNAAEFVPKIPLESK